MPSESGIIWIIMGAVVFVFLVLCLGGVWMVHHRDQKVEEKWRSKYMAERMA